MSLANVLETAANGVAIVSLPIAALAALVAYRAYAAQLAAARDAHMHGVFRAYLEKNLEYDSDLQLAGELSAYRLYAMEEVYGCILAGRAALAGWQGRLIPNGERRRQLDGFMAWEDTVLSHLEDDSFVLEHLPVRMSCYGIPFLELLAARGNLDENLKAQINTHLLAYREASRRPADAPAFHAD